MGEKKYSKWVEKHVNEWEKIKKKTQMDRKKDLKNISNHWDREKATNRIGVRYKDLWGKAINN